MVRILLVVLLSLSAKLVLAASISGQEAELQIFQVDTEKGETVTAELELFPWPHKDRRRINRASRRARKKASKGSRRHAKGVMRSRGKKKQSGSRSGVNRKQIIKKKEGCNT